MTNSIEFLHFITDSNKNIILRKQNVSQVYNSIKHHLYIALPVYQPKSSLFPLSYIWTHLPFTTPLHGSYHTVVCVYGFCLFVLVVCFAYSSVVFSLLLTNIIKTKKITTVGKDVEKLEPSCIMGVNVKWCHHCGRQYGWHTWWDSHSSSCHWPTLHWMLGVGVGRNFDI